MGDRPFQRTLYSKFGSYSHILDVGVRGYNRNCRDYIRQAAESDGTNPDNNIIKYPKYYQMEPFPPDNSNELNNDGLLQCYMHQVADKYPEMQHSFDLIIDFGVFGWDAVQSSFSEDDVRQYVQSVLFLLKRKNEEEEARSDSSLWVLKVDRGWVATKRMDQEEFFAEFILPYFNMGKFHEWESGHALKNGNFQFYFLYRK